VGYETPTGKVGKIRLIIDAVSSRARSMLVCLSNDNIIFVLPFEDTELIFSIPEITFNDPSNIDVTWFSMVSGDALFHLQLTVIEGKYDEGVRLTDNNGIKTKPTIVSAVKITSIEYEVLLLMFDRLFFSITVAKLLKTNR